MTTQRPNHALQPTPCCAAGSPGESLVANVTAPAWLSFCR